MKLRAVALVILTITLFGPVEFAQDRSTGGVRGKVRVEKGSAGGVSVVVRQGDREITRVTTNNSGDFSVAGLAPGIYGLTFRKAGLSVATIEAVSITPGKPRSLSDRLYLTIDEGSLAFIKGSVFSDSGRSFPGVRVELARILEDGSLKKIDGRVTNDLGQFSFRLAPEAAKYRLTAKADHMVAATKDVEIDGPVVYRVALSLLPAPK
jgi:hypothetical protein